MNHSQWNTRRQRSLADSKPLDPAYEEEYAKVHRAYPLGQMVYDRRIELGLSQTELARRAGMSQAAISRLETGGVTPTVRLLERLAAALDADLVVSFVPHAA